MKFVILTHGGAGSPAAKSDGCHKAAASARAVLEHGGSALAAAVAATVVLEDDPRFNAGTGSNIRLDGTTIEMDAAASSSNGSFGAVACIRRVKNPILVALRVMETPHRMLVGSGATLFARQLGFTEYDPTTAQSVKKYARALAELAGRGDGTYTESAAPWLTMIDGQPVLRKFWNFEAAPPLEHRPSRSKAKASSKPGTAKATSKPGTAKATSKPGTAKATSKRHTQSHSTESDSCDTVGAVVRDVSGAFAATASTGGTLYTLQGRVGDSPLFGAGVYAGPHGAVAATGIGEEITRHLLAKTVYDWLAQGTPAKTAARRAVALFPKSVEIGVLVVSRRGHAIASNRSMASAIVSG